MDKTGKRRHRRIDDVGGRAVIDLVGGNDANNRDVFLEDRRAGLIGRRQRHIVRADRRRRCLREDVDDCHRLVLARRLVVEVSERIVNQPQCFTSHLVFNHKARHRNGGVAVVNLVRNDRHERQWPLVDRHIMRATGQRVVDGKPSAVCQSKRAD